MTLPVVPPVEQTVEALLDERDTLRTYLLDRLDVPDLQAAQLLHEASKTVEGIDTDSLSMSNDETGEDNRSAVRSLDNDLETIASSVDGALDEVVDRLLVRPFQEALSTAKVLRLGITEWSPENWLKAFAERAVPMSARAQALSAILTTVSAENVPVWYDLVRSQGSALHQWSGWTTALRAAGRHEPVVGAVLDRLLHDDTVVMPAPTRGRPVSDQPVEEIKRSDLLGLAWRGLGQPGVTSEQALRRAVWARVSPDPERMDWHGLMTRVLDNARQPFYQGADNTGVAANRVPSMLDPFRELLALPCVDAWMGRSEHWAPVAETHPGALATPDQQPVTWTALALRIDQAGHPHLAQGFRALGESWALRQTIDSLKPSLDAAPLVRERSRL